MSRVGAPFLASLVVLCAVALGAHGAPVKVAGAGTAPGTSPPPPPPPMDGPGIPTKCGTAAGCILKGTPISKATVNDAGECCDLCRYDSGCDVFTVNENLYSDNCLLFKEDSYADDFEEDWICGYTIF